MLKKLIIAQTVKTLPNFYETRRFATVFTAIDLNHIYPVPIIKHCIRFLLLLFPHLCETSQAPFCVQNFSSVARVVAPLMLTFGETAMQEVPRCVSVSIILLLPNYENLIFSSVNERNMPAPRYSTCPPRNLVTIQPSPRTFSRSCFSETFLVCIWDSKKSLLPYLSKQNCSSYTHCVFDEPEDVCMRAQHCLSFLPLSVCWLEQYIVIRQQTASTNWDFFISSVGCSDFCEVGSEICNTVWTKLNQGRFMPWTKSLACMER